MFPNSQMLLSETPEITVSYYSYSFHIVYFIQYSYCF